MNITDEFIVVFFENNRWQVAIYDLLEEAQAHKAQPNTTKIICKKLFDIN